MNKGTLVQLSSLRSGGCGTVVKLEGGRGILGRLAALGFTPGANVTVMRNHGSGPIIVTVLDTQIALGRGQAAKVYVRCDD
jgi:ferrous iron transport protein A